MQVEVLGVKSEKEMSTDREFRSSESDSADDEIVAAAAEFR